MPINPTGIPGFPTAALNRINDAQGRTLEKIASGKQINRASDDAAGLAVLTAMESQTRGLNLAIANRQDEVSLFQTAEGALGTTQSALLRIRDLSLQAANGTLTNEDRAAIQQEVVQLRAQIDQTANGTQFNGKNLLDGSFSMKAQNGSMLNVSAFGAGALGLDGIDLSTQDGAVAAVGLTDKAMSAITTERSRLGALENGNVAEVESLYQQMVDTMSAQSRIGDADIARQLINLTTQKIQAETAIKAFHFDDERRQMVLNLLNQ